MTDSWQRYKALGSRENPKRYGVNDFWFVNLSSKMSVLSDSLKASFFSQGVKTMTLYACLYNIYTFAGVK